MKRMLVLWLMIGCLFLTACGETATYVDMSITRRAASLLYQDATENTLTDLCEQADAVVMADVDGIFVRDAEIGLTYTQLTVREVWKGDTAKQIYLGEGFVQMIDETDPNRSTAEVTPGGEPLMRQGNRVILFLAEDSAEGLSPYYTVLGGGKFFYDQDGTYHNALMYSPNFEEYRQRYERGEELIVDAPHLDFADMIPKTAREFKKFVRDCVK